MKLQAERFEGSNAISRYGPDGVIVANSTYRHSVIVPWTGTVVDWSIGSFGELTLDHFQSLVALSPELVIFGSGPRIRFPSPALLRPLMTRRIGLETMDTAAACRTYNVLLSEGRAVVAALLFESTTEHDARGQLPP